MDISLNQIQLGHFSELVKNKEAVLNTLKFAYRNCDAGFDSDNFQLLIDFVKSIDYGIIELQSEEMQEQEERL